MAKRKNVAKDEASTKDEKVVPIEKFDLSEVYRIIHLEQIPGFKMLKKERDYLEAYRRSLRQSYEASVPEGTKVHIHEEDPELTNVDATAEELKEESK